MTLPFALAGSLDWWSFLLVLLAYALLGLDPLETAVDATGFERPQFHGLCRVEPLNRNQALSFQCLHDIGAAKDEPCPPQPARTD